MLRYIFFFFLCVIEPVHSFTIAAYYQNWSQYYHQAENRSLFTLEQVDPSLIDDLYYAFAIFGYLTKEIAPTRNGITGDYFVQPLYGNDQTQQYEQLKQLKTRSNGRIKTILGVGGWNFNNPQDPTGIGQSTHLLFSKMVSKEQNRKQFIDSAIAYAHRWGFNGIEIDWEYPGDPTRGGVKEDFANCIVFLKECRTAFQEANPPLFLSMAFPATIPDGTKRAYSDVDTWYGEWTRSCAAHLDRITFMAYDFHTSNSQEKITGVNAPLARDTNPSSPLSVVQSLNTFLSYDIPPEKILLGLPLYGWSYGGVSELTLTDQSPGKPFKEVGIAGDSIRIPGMLAYFEIADKIAKKKLSLGIDTITATAYGYNIEDMQWVSFDTPETIAQKVAVARQKKLGGVIYWSIDLDESQWDPKFPNIRAARQP